MVRETWEEKGERGTRKARGEVRGEGRNGEKGKAGRGAKESQHESLR